MTDFARLVLDADTTGLKRAEGDLKGVTREAARTAADIGRSMRNLGLGLTAGVSAPLGYFGKQAAQAAIDAQEMESAFDVVFGNMSGDVRAWAVETGDALGRSTQEVQRSALAFQELFGKSLDPEQAAEMSKQFAVLTQDLASFKNLSNEVAQQKLFSGLVGEAEPLRQVGVFLSETALQAKAAELGLGGVNGVLTDQEKIVARAAIIQEQLAQANGDVARTSGSTANQIKTAQAAFEELQVALGTKLLPALTPLISGFASLVDNFAKLPSGVQSAAVAIGAVAVAAGPLLVVFGSLVTLAPAIGTGFAAIGAAAAPIAAIIAGVAAAGYLIYENWDKISPVLDAVRERFEEAIGPKLRELVSGAIEKFTELWEGPLGSMIRVAGEALLSFQMAYAAVLGEGLLRVLDAAVTAVSGAFNVILDALTVVSRLLQGDFAGAWEAAKDMVRGAAETILGVLNALVPEVVQMGANIIQGIVRGIQSAPGAVRDALMSVVNAGVSHVKSFLGIQSPSRLFMQYGEYVSEGFAIGIESGTSQVSAAMDGLAEAANDNNGKLSESFDQMSRRVLGSLQGLSSGIKSGGFLDILGGVVGLLSTASDAGWLKGISGARANGGPVSAGQTYLVGEKGPELFTAPGTGRIISNDNLGGSTHITVEASPYFDVRVDGRIVTNSPAVADAGANMAMRRSARMQRRAVR